MFEELLFTIYKRGLPAAGASKTTDLTGLLGFSEVTWRGDELEYDDRSGLVGGLATSR